MSSAVPHDRYAGSPMSVPVDAMGAGVGPGAWAERPDTPDVTLHGQQRIVPLRADASFFLEPRDPDPRGMSVVGLDGEVAGTVAEVWIDRAEPQVRYLEILVAATGRLVLLPILHCRFDVEQRKVRVQAIKARHFAQVPRTRSFNEVTLLEEDKIGAFYAGGYLYADTSRLEPGIM